MSYAQFGEDRIVDQLLGYPTYGCVADIGAGDGLEISNSRLFRERGWDTLLIEADEKHVESLQSLEPPARTVRVAVVTPENVNTLVEPPVDVLSIDVDGDDIFIFEALAVRPQAIIVEHNPTMPYWMDVQPARLGLRVGASVAALTRVAEAKGYGLAAVTHCNAIFLRDSESITPPIYRPSYSVATEYFTGRPIYLGEAPWGVQFDEPISLEDVIVR